MVAKMTTMVMRAAYRNCPASLLPASPKTLSNRFWMAVF
jgi:hypothetical protein